MYHQLHLNPVDVGFSFFLLLPTDFTTTPSLFLVIFCTNKVNISNDRKKTDN